MRATLTIHYEDDTLLSQDEKDTSKAVAIEVPVKALDAALDVAFGDAQPAWISHNLKDVSRQIKAVLILARAAGDPNA